MAKIIVTDVGRAVATSGLLPETARYFVDYFVQHCENLQRLLPEIRSPDDPEHEIDDVAEFDANLAFVLCFVCLTSPEYGSEDLPPRRFIPYMIDGTHGSERADQLQEFLPVDPWNHEAPAANASDVLVDWAEGVALAELEDMFDRLRGGVLRELANSTSSHMAGMADVTFALASVRGPKIPAPLADLIDTHRTLFYRLTRRIRQLAYRISSGLPEDVLWMTQAVDDTGRKLIGRNMILRLREAGLETMDSILDGGRRDEINEVFRQVEGDARNAAGFVEGVERTRLNNTSRRRESQKRRADDECHPVIDDYYNTKGTDFEKALEVALNCLDIKILARDDETRRGKGFPDFILDVFNGAEVVVECKSKENDAGVSLKDARDVFGKAGTNGLNDQPLITVCQAYVAPEVPRLIEECTRLTVINAEDLAEALLQYHKGRIDGSQLLTWLTTPGQSRASELPL